MHLKNSANFRCWYLLELIEDRDYTCSRHAYARMQDDHDHIVCDHDYRCAFACACCLCLRLTRLVMSISEYC